MIKFIYLYVKHLYLNLTLTSLDISTFPTCIASQSGKRNAKMLYEFYYLEFTAFVFVDSLCFNANKIAKVIPHCRKRISCSFHH